MGGRGRLALVAGALSLSCWQHTAVPAAEPDEALLGRCGAGVDRAKLCGEWEEAVEACEGPAHRHDAFPELVPETSCFVRVHNAPGRLPRAGPIPRGCGYPDALPVVRAQLSAEAARYERIAAGRGGVLPMVLACELPEPDRRAAAKANARTLRALAKRVEKGERWPYGAVSTFGFGHGAHNMSKLVSWRPDDDCRQLDKWEMDLLSINRNRAGRAAAAYHGRVAPVVTVSGGAVHSSLYEAFMLQHLLSCELAVPRDAVLLDPCADHTHTNMRNTGALVRQLGARTAYIVTSSDLQGKYLQEWSIFSLIGGSVDQRALRDWGYLPGSWRQASVGMDAGFWFTPYRFWGEPAEGLGSATCMR